MEDNLNPVSSYSETGNILIMVVDDTTSFYLTCKKKYYDNNKDYLQLTEDLMAIQKNQKTVFSDYKKVNYSKDHRNFIKVKTESIVLEVFNLINIKQINKAIEKFLEYLIAFFMQKYDFTVESYDEFIKNHKGSSSTNSSVTTGAFIDIS